MATELPPNPRAHRAESIEQQASSKCYMSLDLTFSENESFQRPVALWRVLSAGSFGQPRRGLTAPSASQLPVSVSLFNVCLIARLHFVR